MRKIALFVFGFIALTAAHSAPAVFIRTEVSPRDIYIGDAIHYRLTVTYSTSVTPAPIMLDKKLGEFELLDIQSSQPASQKDGTLKIVHSLTLTVFSTGSLTIPGLNLIFSAKDHSLSEARTEEVPIKVKSLLEEKGNEGKLRPLKGLFNVRSYFWLWVILGIIAGVLILSLIWKAVRRRRSGGLNSTAPMRPPEEVAFEALRQLESENLIAQGEIKTYYDRLSIICREYIENRTQLSVMEKTTSELMNELRKVNFNFNAANLCRDLFETADLVKFAKFLPSVEEAGADLEKSRNLVLLTTPQTPAEPVKESIPV